MKHSVIKCEGIEKTYGSGDSAVEAIKKANFEIYSGETVALLGPSGSGKTTLITMIGCITEPSGGKLTLSGECVYDSGWMIPDTRKIRREKAAELLDYLGVGDKLEKMPSELSGGQSQRVAIARSLANNPQIILADEPTAALDSQRALSVMELLRSLAHEHDVAIIVVTHDERMLPLFDRILRVEDGVVLEMANT